MAELVSNVCQSRVPKQKQTVFPLVNGSGLGASSRLLCTTSHPVSQVALLSRA